VSSDDECAASVTDTSELYTPQGSDASAINADAVVPEPDQWLPVETPLAPSAESPDLFVPVEAVLGPDPLDTPAAPIDEATDWPAPPNTSEPVIVPTDLCDTTDATIEQSDVAIEAAANSSGNSSWDFEPNSSTNTVADLERSKQEEVAWESVAIPMDSGATTWELSSNDDNATAHTDEATAGERLLSHPAAEIDEPDVMKAVPIESDQVPQAESVSESWVWSDPTPPGVNPVVAEQVPVAGPAEIGPMAEPAEAQDDAARQEEPEDIEAIDAVAADPSSLSENSTPGAWDPEPPASFPANGPVEGQADLSVEAMEVTDYAYKNADPATGVPKNMSDPFLPLAIDDQIAEPTVGAENIS